jgi:ribonuclease HI
MKKQVTIYTDGASRGNPGKGGWGAILMTEKEVVELAGRKDDATNNQMELEGAIQALATAVKKFKGDIVVLHSDSAYVLGGLNSWLDGWVRNNWVTVTKKPVENKLQWQKLLALRDELGRDLQLVKVAGHSGHDYNDRCDELAVAYALDKKIPLFKGTYTAYIGYLAEHPPVSVQKKAKSSSSSSSKKAYSYISLVGGKVYRDTSWSACEARVKDTRGAKYKKVFSKEEETELMQDYTLASLL